MCIVERRRSDARVSHLGARDDDVVVAGDIVGGAARLPLPFPLAAIARRHKVKATVAPAAPPRPPPLLPSQSQSLADLPQSRRRERSRMPLFRIRVRP